MFSKTRDHSRSHHPSDQRLPDRRYHHPDLTKLGGWKAMQAEEDIPEGEWDKEKAWALRMGLTNTFLKAPYTEDVTEVGNYDACVLGAPFDGGTTYRPGTRFGPQGVRKISALYTPYNYEMGVDLREQMSLCDAGDIFTIPGNIEKTSCRSSSVAITQSAFLVYAGLRNARRKKSVSSTLTAMRIFKRKTWMSGCTRPRGSIRPTCPMCLPRTLCRLASVAGRSRARR